jgi:hypothetical protein
MLSAEDLRRVMAEKEAKKASEAMSKLRAAEEEKRHRHEMFMAGKLTPERMQQMMSRIHS